VFEQLKKQVEAYELEKIQWVKERDAAQQVIQKLKEENELLKAKHSHDAVKVRAERLHLVGLLEEKLNANAPDGELMVILEQIRTRCHAIKQLSQQILCQYMSPDAATYLANVGFFNDESIEVDKPSKAESLYSFATKLYDDVPDLTEDQKQRINAHVEKFYMDLKNLLEERRILALDLHYLYTSINPHFQGNPSSSSSPSASSPSSSCLHSPLPGPADPITGDGSGAAPNMLDRLASLHQLRENFIAESDLSLGAIASLLDELTPRQAAKFLIRAHFVHNAVIQLQHLWEVSGGRISGSTATKTLVGILTDRLSEG